MVARETCLIEAPPVLYPLLACPVCEGFELDALDDGSESGLPAYRCRGCGLGIEHALRLPQGAYAATDYDRLRSHGAGSDRWARYHHDAAVAVKRFEQLKAFLPREPRGPSGRPLRWVDVGCNSGAFLVVARRRGWNVVGVEADETAARQTSLITGVQVVTPDYWAATVAQFEADPKFAEARPFVLSFWDVLEHLIDPVEAFRVAARALQPGGLLVVEAPDLDQAEDFKAWHHRRITTHFTEHLWHFSPGSLDALARRYTPELARVHSASPVAGRLQMAWQKKA